MSKNFWSPPPNIFFPPCHIKWTFPNAPTIYLVLIGCILYLTEKFIKCVWITWGNLALDYLRFYLQSIGSLFLLLGVVGRICQKGPVAFSTAVSSLLPKGMSTPICHLHPYKHRSLLPKILLLTERHWDGHLSFACHFFQAYHPIKTICKLKQTKSILLPLYSWVLKCSLFTLFILVQHYMAILFTLSHLSISMIIPSSKRSVPRSKRCNSSSITFSSGMLKKGWEWQPGCLCQSWLIILASSGFWKCEQE